MNTASSKQEFRVVEYREIIHQDEPWQWSHYHCCYNRRLSTDEIEPTYETKEGTVIK